MFKSTLQHLVGLKVYRSLDAKIFDRRVKIVGKGSVHKIGDNKFVYFSNVKNLAQRLMKSRQPKKSLLYYLTLQTIKTRKFYPTSFWHFLKSTVVYISVIWKLTLSF